MKTNIPLPQPTRPSEPSHQEINTLVTLFNEGRYPEAATLAQALTERFPLNGFCWKALGALLKQMGRTSDALLPMQKAAALSSNDPESHHNLGNALRELGRLEEAEASCRRALQINPGYAEAHCNLGAIQQKLFLLDEAEASFRRALQAEPHHAEAHYNLGNTLHELDRLDEAEASHRRALQIKPHFADAYLNLGIILNKLGRPEEAEASYGRTLQINPNFAKAHNNLGNALKDLGRFDDAAASFRRALEIEPDLVEALKNLGNTLMAQGKLDEALACFRQQVQFEPGNNSARHMIASMTGDNTERAPVDYVEKLFNDYADKFDTHLVQVLQYDAPEKLAELVKQHAAPPSEKWRVLDLGCGTGLAGVAIAPFARQLVGVDLSAKMLEKALARNLYQRLERLDLLAMMRSEKASSYDVIIATDVFIYLGKLDEIISEAKRLLCPNGIFAFSIESLEASENDEARQECREYQLESTGRYTHSIPYLTRLAAANDFLPQEIAATQLRLEKGKPVNGHLVLWKNRNFP